ncbi:MAG: PEP/pyruvate-binding domain-containing protein [Anaerolineae bacterium]
MTPPDERAGDYILWFDDKHATELGSVGGKGANLSRLVHAGFRVPRGFSVAASAYRDAVATSDTAAEISNLVSAAATADEVDAASAEARALITALEVPEEIARSIAEAYAELGDDVPVAIRSSATAEDLPEASFAGQQDTYLNVRGVEQVLENVRRCWASLWSARAVRYRIEHGFAHDDVLLAVVVQEMIESEVAGVMFTANPVNGRYDETVVNASFGLGEAVVSGLVTPDTFVVQPDEGVVRSRDIATKEVEIVYAPEGTVHERPVATERANAPSLSEEQVLELARLGTRVTEYYGSPQDTEWGLRDGVFYLLQSRPITTLGRPPEIDPRDEWTRAMFSEILPDAPSPAFCSVLRPVFSEMFEFTFGRLGQRRPAGLSPIEVFYHQPYLNVRYIRAALSRLPESTREGLVDNIANPFGDHESRARGRPSLSEVELVVNMLRAAQSLPGEVADAVAGYYADLADIESHDTYAMTLTEIADDIKRLALDVLPPLVAWDFLLIVALGFVHRLVESMVDRSGLPDAELLRGQLMSGVTGNLTMQTNKRLWQLAQSARSAPAVAAALLEGPEVTVLERVRAEEGGQEFLDQLGEFLSQYGHREVVMDIAYPTWGEDPAPVLGFVRSYLATDQAPDPAELEQALAATRSEAASAVASALGATLGGRLIHQQLFRWALRRSELLGRDRDTMHFHWTAAFPVLRRLLHGLADRAIEAGHLERRSDVYLLTIDDMVAYSAEPRPLQDLVDQRRESWERDKSRQWPIAIVEGRAVYEDVSPRHDLGRETLLGLAGSPGVATGPVCVVRGPDEFGKLSRGDILVAPLTNPVWTPLFAVAGGVVTDSGGILSHGAIVAREYGIPAVLGARGATTALKDGQIVTVDGSNGTVAIESSL